MLGELRKLCQNLGIEVSDGEGTTPDGAKIKVLAIRHGENTLLAFDEKNFVALNFIIDLTPEQAESLERKNKQSKGELYWLLRNQLLQGRCGYKIIADKPEHPDRIRRITVEQRLVVNAMRPETQQRFLDATQEIVIAAVRAIEVLKQGLAPADTSATPAISPEPPPEMYR